MRCDNFELTQNSVSDEAYNATTWDGVTSLAPSIYIRNRCNSGRWTRYAQDLGPGSQGSYKND